MTSSCSTVLTILSENKYKLTLTNGVLVVRLLNRASSFEGLSQDILFKRVQLIHRQAERFALTAPFILLSVFTICLFIIEFRLLDIGRRGITILPSSNFNSFSWLISHALSVVLVVDGLTTRPRLVDVTDIVFLALRANRFVWPSTMNQRIAF